MSGSDVTNYDRTEAAAKMPLVSAKALDEDLRDLALHLLQDARVKDAAVVGDLQKEVLALRERLVQMAHDLLHPEEKDG